MRRKPSARGWSRGSCPADKLFDEALAVAAKIAGYSLPVVLKIKEAINRAYESSLSEGLLSERREFHATFALDDQKEGMRAFVEKRKPSSSTARPGLTLFPDARGHAGVDQSSGLSSRAQILCHLH